MNHDDNTKFPPALPYDDDNSIKFYEDVAECVMNDSDSLKSVKLRAKNLAQVNIQKKIAEYIYDFWKNRYLTLPDDEVLSIANEISTIKDVKYNVKDSDDDNVVIRATITAQIDDKDIMNYIIRFFKERIELKAQNEALRNENKDLKRQIAELKRNHANNQKITLQVVDNDKISLANQKYSEAWELRSKNDNEGAIKLCNEAIELNPNAYNLYLRRGYCYKALGNEAKAQEDFKKAEELRKKG